MLCCLHYTALIIIAPLVITMTSYLSVMEFSALEVFSILVISGAFACVGWLIQIGGKFAHLAESLGIISPILLGIILMFRLKSDQVPLIVTISIAALCGILLHWLMWSQSRNQVTNAASPQGESKPKKYVVLALKTALMPIYLIWLKHFLLFPSPAEAGVSSDISLLAFATTVAGALFAVLCLLIDFMKRWAAERSQ